MAGSSVSGVSLLLVESADLADGRRPGFAFGPHDALFTDELARDHLGLQFLQIAAARGAAPLVTTPANEWSYASLSAAALAIAVRVFDDASDAAAADAHGRRVIILLPNSPEYIAAFYGVLIADGVAVPVAPKIEAETLRRIIETTQATHLITTASVLATRTDLQSLPAQTIAWPESSSESLSIVEKTTTAHAGRNNERRLAAIFFTGGTSGTPKGVMLSHRNLIANAESIRQYLQITAADNPLCILPFMHAFGNSVLQSHVLAGARLTFAGHTAFPQTIVDALASQRCTSLSGVPDLFRMLLSRTSLGRQTFPDLRYMAVAGGSLPQPLSLEMAEKIAPSQFYVMYGQTEATARLAYVPPEQLRDRPEGAIGEPIPGVTLQIVDDEGRPAVPGQTGELRARGPNIMLGYWNDLDETDNRIDDGWLRTGDLAAYDEHGWIVLRGRSNSFVKIAGFRVHPQELEEFAVRRFQAMQAVSVPVHGAVGTRLALFVKFPSDRTPVLNELVATCRNELPHYLAPEIIQIVEEFPLNHAMKIDRPALTRVAEAALHDRRISA